MHDRTDVKVSPLCPRSLLAALLISNSRHPSSFTFLANTTASVTSVKPVGTVASVVDLVCEEWR